MERRGRNITMGLRKPWMEGPRRREGPFYLLSLSCLMLSLVIDWLIFMTEQTNKQTNMISINLKKHDFN